jgi:uridine phosphorylase
MNNHLEKKNYEPANHQEPFTASDLPFDDQGRIYHLRLKPGQVAPDILMVGDPGRAEMIGANYLGDVEFKHEHRGWVTVTGTANVTGKRATILSPIRTTAATSGVGTPSLEIVVNELVLLNEIDFKTRKRKESFPRLHIIRVGTSGALQSSTVLGTPIITTYAVGMDNTGLFYETGYTDDVCRRLENQLDMELNRVMSENSRFYGKIHPYVSRAEPTIVRALMEASEELQVFTKQGLTVSNSGFFAPQGRDTARVKPSIQDLDLFFSRFDPGLPDQKIENMEMEASFLLHFMGGLGYWAGAICPAIANRRTNSFDNNYQESVKNAVEIALLALQKLRK